MPGTRKTLFGRGGVRARRAQRARTLTAITAIVVAVVAGVALLNVAPATHPRVLESIFQDDSLLIYQPLDAAGNAEVQRTLETMKSLGADRIRLIIQWAYIAPAQRPPGFDAADPAAYPPGAWAQYDRVDRLAHDDGLAVYFDVTAPGPLWAMAPAPAGVATDADHYDPSPAAFERFVEAIGRRYDGSYSAPAGPGASAPGPLPRVSFWSVWNEPNQPGWLAPQWTTGADGAPEPFSPRLYRDEVDAAWAGLAASGHTPATDTILVGELAPEGSSDTAAEDAITPIPFLEALYCVGGRDRPLRGAAATAVGCPAVGPTGVFVAAHPALFEASGFAHHPYSFLLGPAVSLPNPDYVPLADLGRLQRALDAIFRAYRVDRTLPIYLTEYGYETDPPRPPDVFPPGVPERDQSLYLNEAEYLAYKDPRVRALAQFELRDSLPDTHFPPSDLAGYWSTFQTGLEFADGRPKFALAAYPLPIYLPQTSAPPGGTVLVWGMLRAAPNHTTQTARVQWRPPHGAYRTIATVTTSDPSGFLTTRVHLPGLGAIRLAWTEPSGHTITSRAVGVSVAGG